MIDNNTNTNAILRSLKLEKKQIWHTIFVSLLNSKKINLKSWQGDFFRIKIAL